MSQINISSSATVPFFVALDLPDPEAIHVLATGLSKYSSGFKIGSEAFLALGREGLQKIIRLGRPVFLDLKWFDIPNTVASAVKLARDMGVSYATLHLLGGTEMLRRAQEAAGNELQLLGVTALTSYSPAGWHESVAFSAKNAPSLEESVLLLAQRAQHAGIAGIVCSGDELPKLRDVSVKKIVPGVRWGNAIPGDDQSRTQTPQQLWNAGATSLVVGRPILKAPDPVAAAHELLTLHRSLKKGANE